MIPKILSQTAATPILPPSVAAYSESWRRLNPEMDYRLYDDDASRALFKSVFPQFLIQYDALPFPVMRADVFRLAVIYRDGGWYADVDMECLKPLPDHAFQHECVLSIEAHLTAKRTAELSYTAPFQIANCIFAATPGHPFLRAAVEESFARFQASVDITLADIEQITGPRMLTQLYYRGGWKNLSVARQIALLPPLHFPNIWPINKNMHARHHTLGSWKDNSIRAQRHRRWIERDRLVNPFPTSLFLTEAEQKRLTQ